MKGQKNIKTEKRRYTRYLIMAFCLVICLSTVSVIASKYITDLTISSCFQKLRDSTSQYAVSIRQDVESDVDLMKTLADYIAQTGNMDPEQISKTFVLSEAGDMIDKIGLILPDGQVYADDEAFSENLADISFEEEAAKGQHVSGRITDRHNPQAFYLYHFAPIIIEDKTEGLLCGMIDLEKLGRKYAQNIGIEGTTIHLIEGQSSAFLIDTVHPALEKADSLRKREIKKGYSIDTVLDDIIGGTSGEAAFFSTSLREYFYCAYEPVGVNDWMIMLGQPESIAFREAKDVRAALRHFAEFETVVFLIYLFIASLGVRRASNEKEKELDRIQYILKIEETLFNAARNPERIEEALQEIAKKLSAEYAFFIIYDRNGTEKMYVRRENKRKLRESFSKSDFPVLCSKFLPEGNLVSYDMHELTGEAKEEYQKLKRLGIESLMLIPVNEPDHTHVGSLGVANMHSHFQSAELLECVMLSFSMAIKNIMSFQAIEEMGIRDYLTGLRNRNCFQQSMAIYEKEQDSSLCCIYIDADGLHEINNHYGHEAGDLLLKTVARELTDEYGDENVYRIGGDEFVAFCRGWSKEQVMLHIRCVEELIRRNGYHISVGTERREDEPFVYKMIKQAEMKMFEAKKRYHETKGDAEQIREMDQKLEETLMEKRNLDIFRSVLASKYLGVYIVDLDIDTFRFIYIPSYFNAAAEQSGGKFSEAVRIYVQSYVCGEYHSSFIQLLDYQYVEECLNRGEKPELHYVRPDGIKILLRIYRSPDYGQTCRECIWTFEKANE